MLLSYALEARSNWFVLAFAVSCVMASISGFLQGACPFEQVYLVFGRARSMVAEASNQMSLARTQTKETTQAKNFLPYPPSRHFSVTVVLMALPALVYNATMALSQNIKSGKNTSSTQVPPQRAALNGWKQVKKTSWLGDSISYVSKDGYIFTSAQLGLNVVCAHGSSKVILTRPKDKLYFVGSTAQGVRRLGSTNMTLSLEYSLKPPAVPWTFNRTTTYKGHPVDVWRASELIHTPNDAPNFTGYEFWAAKDITIPDAMVKYNTIIHQWPLIVYLPLRVVHVHKGKPISTNLETTQIKPCEVPRTMFDIPKDYSETKDERKIGLTHQDVGHMIDDLGLFRKGAKK